jgi:hypothetical protein
VDSPKSLKSDEQRKLRQNMLNESHVKKLTEFVDLLRIQKGSGYLIPYFDPYDGGNQAEVLFLLEAAGPKAITTGFISRSNPDETAKNFYLLNQEAGVERALSIIWNIVPWYIGSGQKIRPANKRDVLEGCQSLGALIQMLSNLKVIVLVGRKAQSARKFIENLKPNIPIVDMPHTSPMFVNQKPNNRSKILIALKDVKLYLDN